MRAISGYSGHADKIPRSRRPAETAPARWRHPSTTWAWIVGELVATDGGHVDVPPARAVIRVRRVIYELVVGSMLSNFMGWNSCHDAEGRFF